MAAYVQDSIMLLGDSLTQGGFDLNGFASKLAHVYNRKMDVVNRGFSGYNTDWIIPVFEQVFATQHEQQHVPRVRLLVIWFGANDAALPVRDQHVPLGRFRENLAQLVRMVSAPGSRWYSPATRVVLMSPPPVNTEMWGARQKERGNVMDRDFETTRKYAEAVGEVAREEGVAGVDVWTSVWERAGRTEGGLSRFLTDGLHLNEDGYAIVFEELTKCIAEKYPELHHENLRFTFVPFNEICEDLPNYKTVTQKRSAFPDE